MNFKDLKRYWYIFILIIIIFLLFFPTQTTYYQNFKIYHSIIDLGFADYGVFSALIVGLLSFTATIYTNDKNLKAIKLTTLPEDYLDLTLSLELLFVEHNMKRNNENYDLIETFIKFFALWKSHKAVFQLMFPRLNKELLDLIAENLLKQKNNKQYIANAQKIMLDIKLCILGETESDEDPYKLRDNEKCTDEINVEKLDGELDINPSITSLKEYIKKIKGPETRKETEKLFLEMLTTIEKYLSELEEETKRFNDI